ncbi:MAG: sodium:solute symporter family protein [Ignavibacteriae bacterium]|nr:sodium:solute symporter family protein [Ignavibacteriota bacterium]
MFLHLSPFDWTLVACYLAALVVLGIKSKRTSASAADFIVTGRSLTLPGFVAALVSTWYGGILGVGEYSYMYGLSNWFVFGVPYYVFAGIFAVFLARRVHGTRVLTIPQQLRHAYGPKASFLGSVLVLCISSPAPYALMQGVLLQAVTGWPLALCVLLGAGLSLLLLSAGGFSSLVRLDMLQFILMFVGFAVLLAFLIPAHGLLGFFSDHLPPVMLHPSGGHSLQYLLVWFFIAMWTLVSPQFHQFTLSAATPRVAQKGILWSIGFWCVFDAMTTAAGLYARVLLPGLDQPAMAFPALAQQALPSVAKGIFFLGMLATIMSTTDGLTFISAATVGKDILLPLRKQKDDGSLTAMTRIGLLVTTTIAVAGALLLPSVVSLWYVIGTLFIPGLLLPLLTSYTRRWAISPAATVLAMSAGVGASAVSFLVGTLWPNNGAVVYPFGIEPMYAGLATSVLVYIPNWTKSARQAL